MSLTSHHLSSRSSVTLHSLSGRPGEIISARVTLFWRRPLGRERELWWLSSVVKRGQAAGKQRPRPKESFDLRANSQTRGRPLWRLVFLKLWPRRTWKDALRSTVISTEVAILIWVEVTITQSSESSVSSSHDNHMSIAAFRHAPSSTVSANFVGGGGF